MRHDNLTVEEIVNGFPEECKYYIPKIVRQINKVLNKIEREKSLYILEAIEHITPEFARKLAETEMEIQLKKHKNKMNSCLDVLNGKKGRITEEDISNAKEVGIQTLHDSWIKPKFHSNRFIACCPFGHKDNTPSFTVSHRNLFKCFSCQKSGSSIDFIMELEKLEFTKAVKFILARR